MMYVRADCLQSAFSLRSAEFPDSERMGSSQGRGQPIDL